MFSPSVAAALRGLLDSPDHVLVVGGLDCHQELDDMSPRVDWDDHLLPMPGMLVVDLAMPDVEVLHGPLRHPALRRRPDDDAQFQPTVSPLRRVVLPDAKAPPVAEHCSEQFLFHYHSSLHNMAFAHCPDRVASANRTTLIIGRDYHYFVLLSIAKNEKLYIFILWIKRG